MYMSLVVLICLVGWASLVVALVGLAERRTLGSMRVPSARTVALALGVAALAVMCASPAIAAARGITCVALVIAADADARTGLLFDAVTFPTAILAGGIGLSLGDASATASGVALLVGTFGTLVALSRGRAMGLGDVKAMFSIGAAFGPVGALVAVFGASLSGIAATLVGGRFRRRQSVCFGPHLAAGSAIALILADPIAGFLAGR